MRPIALIPIACSIAAVILGFLCLFAGSKPNFMEDYHIVTLNTSSLGHILINSSTTTSTSSSASASPSPTSIASWLTSAIHNATDAVKNATATLENDLQDAEGEVADKLAADLGIKQWYSLHLLDMCEGVYTPNATARGAWYNATSCTNKTAIYHFDPTAEINSELSNGPLHINTSTINWPADIQSTINDLNTALAATFVLYVIGICLSFLTLLMGLLTLFLPNRPALLTPLVLAILALLAFLALGIASAIVTAAMVKIANAVNSDGGQDIGVVAYKGNKYLALTWAATGVMLVAVVGSFLECCFGRRERRREWSEKRI